MTPEELQARYDRAIRLGADPEKLARLRQIALEESGGDEELMAKRADFQELWLDFLDAIRPSPRTIAHLYRDPM
ncbi:hypothetical protein AB0D67_17190 [Streptosporangium sp. NPDC048047]|uniref:hypothetical protein n=1 Tax=Streptosporangium sp. NPDC048047 TaxID=3155748 RepID=UPI003438FFBA